MMRHNSFRSISYRTTRRENHVFAACLGVLYHAIVSHECCPESESSMTNSLTYFRVNGSWRDIEQPIPHNANVIRPQEDDVSAYVDFFPGTESEALPGGLTLYVPDYETLGDTELSLAPITGRTMEAKLCSITVGDPEGVELVANSAWLDFGEPLFYHVRFHNVTYGGALQRLSNFAFQAPVDATPVRITSVNLQRFPYRGP